MATVVVERGGKLFPDYCHTTPDWDWLTTEQSTGTTTMAVEYDGGVVIGADTRQTNGTYISNRVTDKLTRVTDHIYCCRSGSAADTQVVAHNVQYELDMYSIESGRTPLVKVAAKLFQNACYQKRDEISAGILVGGWDEREGGQVYSIPIGGMCVRQPFAVGGSGSTYLYGHVDNEYKKGMPKEECIKFVANAVRLAINRDGSSGGCVRVATIDKDGIHRQTILNNELPQL